MNICVIISSVLKSLKKTEDIVHCRHVLFNFSLLEIACIDFKWV